MHRYILAAVLAVLLNAQAAGAANREEGLRGNAWMFGQSLDRNAPIWKSGLDAQEVKARATGNKKPAKKQGAKKDGTLENALKESAERSFPGGISMETKSSQWKVAPEEKFMRPDEYRPREERHVVRAYADVAPSDNLDINIGPELILKDERHADELSNSSQPDTVLGLGMNFKYDF